MPYNNDGEWEENDQGQSWWDKLHPDPNNPPPRRVVMDGKNYWPIAPNLDALNADPMVQGGHYDWSQMVTTPEGYIAIPEDYAQQVMSNWYSANKINHMSNLDRKSV